MASEVVLVSKDLIFESKIVGTARGLGQTAVAVPHLAAARSHLDPTTRLVLIDLADPTLRFEELRILRAVLPTTTALVAYGSHVDVDRLRAAREAGCHPVLPRSALVERLPEILQHPLSLSGAAIPKA